jgi:glycine/D-amino acid oxidase-like deaminating enzyme
LRGRLAVIHLIFDVKGGELVNTIHSTDVVVVGAGAVGCSIAYWLAKRGKDVTLLDKSGPGTGSSVANFGLVWSSAKEPHTYMDLNLRSSWLWPEMIEELGEDVEYRLGGLKIVMTEKDYEAQAALVERQRKSPLFRGRMISAVEVRDMQPGLSDKVLGALYCPDDGDSNPIKWTYALLRGCKRQGVKVMRDTEVLGFELGEANQVTGVRTSRGRIRTDNAVNTAGIWAAQVAKMVGVTIGLYPQRGQVLISEAVPMILPVAQSTVRQSFDGNIYMGATMEDAGFYWTTTPEGAEKIAKNAAKMVPLLRDVSVIRQFSGLRPMPRDGLPFIGPIPHVPGYYIAVGHSGNTLSPIHGKIISDLIVEGETDVPLEDYDPLRYDERGTRKAGPDRSGH